jgi:N-methylhydantoinase A
MRLDLFDAKTVNGLFAGMRQEAEGVVRLAAPDETLVETRQAFMRYRGQGHEIAVALPNTDFDSGATAEMRKRFEETYATVFGRVIPKLEVEILTWTLSLATARPLPKPAPEPKAAGTPQASGSRELIDPATGQRAQAAVHERESLAPGMALDGPALIVEDGTTTVVPQGFRARINSLKQIVLEDVT